MSIRHCLEKLVAVGRISEKAARDALALHEGIQGRLFPAMGPASADAGAALEAARVMAQAARERKLQAAKIAIREVEVRGRMDRHAKGRTAGLMGALTRDNWEDAQVGDRLNVESHSESVLKKLLNIVDGKLDPYRSTFAGLKQDTVSVWNVVDELYGIDTGDQAAKAAAAAWKEATEYARGRVKREGRPLSVLEDWRLPQMWESSRVRKVSQREFADDLMREVNAGNMRVMDKEGQGEAVGATIPGIIQNAYDDIRLGRSLGTGGGTGAFSNQFRVFRFDNPEAYKRLMKKYGHGDGGLFKSMAGHLQSMSREIAFIEVLGPQYERTFDRLLKAAETDAADRSGLGERVQRFVTMGRPASARGAFDYLRGALSIPESETIAALSAGMRNIQTAARLGSAVVSAVPGDSVTATLAANYNGIPATAVIARTVKDLAGGGAESEAIARQINVTAAAVIDSAIGTKRFADEMVGEGVTGRTADFLMRVSMLNAWTEGLKRSFSLEFMGFAARQADHAFEAVDPVFKGFLQRFGFSPADWDKLRASPQVLADGARFFDVNGVSDQRLADRFMSAVIDERAFAVIEPDARVRQALAGGARRGTIVGEAMRSVTQFKSFPVTFMMTHMMRSLTQGSMGNKAYRTTAMLTLMTVAGAFIAQMQSLISGRDPQDMGDPRFWATAFVRGGGGGMLGDFVYSSTTRGEEGVTQFLAGPGPGAVASAVGDAAQTLMTGSVWTGEKPISGKMLANHIKAWTPGSTMWFSKLATDRLIFDQIQALLDPDYRKSFDRYEKRMKKEFGQEFWWRPGQTSPSRGPDLSRIGGR